MTLTAIQPDLGFDTCREVSRLSLFQAPALISALSVVVSAW